MKHTTNLLMLVSIMGLAHAQNNENSTNTSAQQKRPSWSQGLPERKKTPQFNQPSLQLEPQADNSESTTPERSAPQIAPITAEQPDFSLEKFDVPMVEIQATTPELQTEINTESQPVRLDSMSKRRNRINREKPVNPLHKEYNWNVLSTSPINMPSHVSSVDQISVKIFVKPNGQVSKVTSNDPNVSSTMLKYVSESISRWIFEAPQSIGITDVVSKRFDIEIQS